MAATVSRQPAQKLRAVICHRLEQHLQVRVVLDRVIDKPVRQHSAKRCWGWMYVPERIADHRVEDVCGPRVFGTMFFDQRLAHCRQKFLAAPRGRGVGHDLPQDCILVAEMRSRFLFQGAEERPQASSIAVTVQSFRNRSYGLHDFVVFEIQSGMRDGESFVPFQGLLHRLPFVKVHRRILWRCAELVLDHDQEVHALMFPRSPVARTRLARVAIKSQRQIRFVLTC